MISKINSDEIDIKLFLFSFIKHRYIILLFTLLGIFSGFLINIFSKEKWEGEFQIVLEEKQESTATSLDLANIGKLIRNRAVKQELQTEFEILQSPSVLLDIFENLKSNKINKNDTIYKNVDFKLWKNKYLKIDLIEDTTVLNVSFIDTDRELIIPTLLNISNRYQEYSTEKRNKTLKSGIDFFKTQIPFLEDKSNESLKKAQEFAIKYDLISASGIRGQGIGLPSSTNVEVERIKAATLKREIESKLETIKKIDPNSDKVLYFAKGLRGAISLSSQIKKLDATNQKLNKLKSIFLETDVSILNIKNEKSLLLKALKEDIINYLLATKDLTEAKIKSLIRPKEVIVKYGQLMTNALKDKRILDEFEINYIALKLENSKSKDPWKLITRPSLIPSPIYPKKQRNLATGLFAGIFLSSIGTVFYDRLKKVIYSDEEIKLNTDVPILARFPIGEKDLFENKIDLLYKKILANYKNNLAVLILGDITFDEVSNFELVLKKINPENKVLFTRNILDLKNYEDIVLLVSLGTTTYLQINKALENISLQAKDPIGILLIDNLISFNIS